MIFVIHTVDRTKSATDMPAGAMSGADRKPTQGAGCGSPKIGPAEPNGLSGSRPGQLERAGGGADLHDQAMRIGARRLEVVGTVEAPGRLVDRVHDHKLAAGGASGRRSSRRLDPRTTPG